VRLGDGGAAGSWAVASINRAMVSPPRARTDRSDRNSVILDQSRAVLTKITIDEICHRVLLRFLCVLRLAV